MEAWQRNYLVEMGPQLLETIITNNYLLAALEASQALSSIEVEQIRCKEDNATKTVSLLNIAKTKLNGYKHLVYAISKSQQTGAFDILMKGYVTNVTPSIKVKWGETVKPISSILDEAAVSEICEQMKTSSSKEYVELYAEADSNDGVIKLLHDTIPAENDFYILRSLSKRVRIDKKLFKVNCADVFVIKGIDFKQLATFVESKLIANSSSQLHELVKRFIVLDYDGDWEVLQGLSTNPIHLINYQMTEEEEHFVLDGSSGGSRVIHNFMLKTKGKVISEVDLIEEMLKTSKSGSCICDVPGMGKSLLLANIARKFAARCPDRLVGFIRLSSFMEHVTKDKPPSAATLSFVTNALFEYMSPSLLSKLILDKLLIQTSTGFDLFFDGFDEVQSQHVELTKNFLKTVDINFPNTRIYVTSRLNMRHELEASLKVISYDISPFTHDNQVQFLKSFWKRQTDQGCEERRTEFADFCLKKLKENLSKKELEITGVPLQCRLVAEVFEHNAKLYSDPLRTVPIEQLCRLEGTFVHVYKRYMALRFSHAITRVGQKGVPVADLLCVAEQAKRLMEVVGNSSTYIPDSKPMSLRISDVEQLKQYHFHKAVRTLFPDCMIKFPSTFEEKTITCDLKTAIFRIGVLERGHDGKCETVEFLHRTFAEYLAAEGFARIFDSSCALSLKSKRDLLQFCFTFTLQGKSKYEESILAKYFQFVHPVFVHFLNFFLRDNMNVPCSPEIVSAFTSSVTNEGLYELLGCLLCGRYPHLLKLVKQILSKTGTVKRFSYHWYLFRYDYNHLNQLVRSAAAYSCPSDTTELFSDFCGCDLVDFCKKIDNGWSANPLEVAVRHRNVEMIELFQDKFSFKKERIFIKFFARNHGDSPSTIEKWKNIFIFLLSKDSGLLTESKGMLANFYYHPINMECMKLLLRNGADPYAVKDEKTVVHHAAEYLSRDDLHELCRFLIEDCQAVDLFMEKSGRWNSPIERIRRKASSKTIEMIQLALKQKLNVVV